jgi:hypothetical protein
MSPPLPRGGNRPGRRRGAGNDKEVARSGAIQAALDPKDVTINRAWNEGDRAVAGPASARMAVPEAENGPAAAGFPGIVKQPDFLTPIVPVLSALSDSFVIRSYGEAVTRTARAGPRLVRDGRRARQGPFHPLTGRERSLIGEPAPPAVTAPTIPATRSPAGRA